MKLFTLLTIVAAAIAAPLADLSQEPLTHIQDEETHVPGEIESASIARTLVFRESLTNINTVQVVERDGKKVGVPVSHMEYYADCDNDGDVYWLAIEMSSPWRNIAAGSEYSLSIRVGDHPIGADVNPEYPGGIVSSPAGSPRVSLKGTMEKVEFQSDKDRKRIEKCFVKKHPDAKWWLPGKEDSPHASHWIKFKVESVYMIGGFGDRAFIGDIDSGIYHSVTSLDDHW